MLLSYGRVVIKSRGSGIFPGRDMDMIGRSIRHFYCGCVFCLGQETFLVHGLSRDGLCMIVCDVLTAYC